MRKPGNKPEDTEHWSAEDWLMKLEEDCWNVRDALPREMRYDYDEMFADARESAGGITSTEPQGLLVPTLLAICARQEHDIRRLREAAVERNHEQRGDDVRRW
jgi:hypothetical protein